MSGEASADPVRAIVGAAIRRARTERGLSMREFADRCELSQPFISTIERGLSTPSINTLYRMADVLGLEPSALLPSFANDEIDVVRADEGEMVPSSDRPNSAVGRVLLASSVRGIEIYEYICTRADDLDVWFEHPGHVVLHLIEGHLRVEFAGRPDVVLGPGDCLVHPGPVSHRWEMPFDEHARIFVVIVRPPAPRLVPDHPDS